MLHVDFDTGKKVARRELAIDIFTLYKTRTRPFSQLLLSSHPPSTGATLTNLDVVRAIYGGLQQQQQQTKKQALLEPALVAPHFHYFRLCRVAGVSARTLEATVAEFVPAFQLQPLMAQVADEYAEAADAIFPPLDDALSVSDDCVVPIFVLPLLLTLMPRAYQDAANTLFDLEQLQYRLPHTFSAGQYDRAIADQVFLLGQNRRYVSFLYQSAYHARCGPLCDGERELYEADLAAIVEATRAEAEEARRQRRAISRQTRRLEAGKRRQRR